MTRILALLATFFLTSLAHAQAPASAPAGPTPAQMKQAEEMMALMQQALQPLTQADVDNFITATGAFEKWVTEDMKRLQMFQALPPAQKQAKIKELLGDKAGAMNNLLVLVGRVKFAEQASQPNAKAEMKAKLKNAKAQMGMMEAQMAKMPPATQAQIKAQMAKSFQMLEKAANYPDSSIAIFRKNAAKVKAAMARLEALDKKTAPKK